MRHASQLCRGLAEAARSLERPYVPRHVPLPSSSYSDQAQHSSTPTPPKSPTNHGASRSSEPGPRSEAQHARITKRLTAAGSNLTHHHSQPDFSQSLTSHHPSRDTQRVWSSENHRSKSTSRPRGATASDQSQTPTEAHQSRTRPSSVFALRTTANASAVASPNGTTSRNRIDAASNSIDQGYPSTARGIRLLVAAYPDLSKSQASLLLQTFHQIHTFRSQSPTALLSWYEDLIWTTERQAQESGRIESSQSLSLLLRYAYQRNDLRSLVRLENRAIRLSQALQQSSDAAVESTSSPKELGHYEVDGVCIWPETKEDPRRLAFNLKVAYAAREGNWIRVDELVSQAGLPSSKGPAGKVKSTQPRELMLDSIGWGSLLRFGLGAVRQPDPRQQRETLTGPAFSRVDQSKLTASTAVPDTATTLVESTPEEERARQIQHEDAQTQAKLSVTKRLLPHLLRYTRSAPKQPGDTVRDSSTTDPTTPAWLLQSVLTQLAKRGDAATTIRIVQLALSEKSALDQHALVRGGATSILNLALIACHRNHAVSLTETLRIFNSLTGSTLGQGLSGSAVIASPTTVPGGAGSKANESQLDRASRQASGEQREAKWLVPNEESLVLVLMKVRHPLFRAAWTRRLVDDFKRLFPKVRLTGRTYRMIIDRCVAAAPASQARQEEAISESASAVIEHVVASGRRGRRLRQAAAADKPCTAPLSTSGPTALSASRGPIIKQAILANSLQEILSCFSCFSPTSPLHLSTTNRRRFEHTLLRALRLLNAKKEYHLQKISKQTGDGLVKHHTAAVEGIDRIIGLIAKVKRLGRAEEERRKKSQSKGTAAA